MSLSAWSLTGSLHDARIGYDGVVLNSGKILVAGGYNGKNLTTAELYDPVAHTWTYTGSMAYGRQQIVVSCMI